jgi:hypothetical protein
MDNATRERFLRWLDSWNPLDSIDDPIEPLFVCLSLKLWQDTQVVCPEPVVSHRLDPSDLDAVRRTIAGRIRRLGGAVRSGGVVYRSTDGERFWIELPT